jgi:hypothetical protein
MPRQVTQSKTAKMAVDPRMRFMQWCLRAQVVKKTDTQALVYDNRLDRLPTAGKALGKLGASQEEMRRWWHEFLSAKFGFLALLMQEPNVTDRAAIKLAKHAEPQWNAIYRQWRDQAAAERFVYQLRLAQGPSAQDVAGAWYPDLPEFRRWSELCQESFSAALEHSNVEVDYAKLRAASLERGPSFPAEQWASRLEARAVTHVAEKLRLGLEVPRLPDDETLEWVEHQASQINTVDDGDGDAGQLIRLPVYRSIVRVANEFVAITRSPAHDPEAHVRSLISIVKDEFDCKFCDFLSASEDGRSLSFSSSTATVDPDEYSRLQADEYFFGHGITGSLLLAGPKDDDLCVGTNKLDEDERQSPGHRLAFEGPYGKVDNFWVFPVWQKARLLGGFRVITRLEPDKETCAPAGWPLFVRLQLSALARFVSELWEYLGDGQAGRVSPRVAGLDATCSALATKLGIEEVDSAFLEAVVEHVEMVNLMRIEKRGLGVCLGIAPNNGAFTELNAYAALDNTELRREAPNPALASADDVLNWCSRLYNKVAPTYGIFAFDVHGELLGVYDLRYRNGRAGLDAVAPLSDHDGVTVVMLQRDSASAGIYREGKKKAEYILQERLGEWRLRVFDDLQREIAAASTLPQKVLSDVVDAVFHLSYQRVGAFVIVGEDLVSRLDANGFRIDSRLNSMEKRDFENWAKEDGAVLISPQGNVEMGGCILNVAEDLMSPAVRGRLERDQKGGRHKAAALVSAAFSDALVLVVSENRGITVFSAGNAVLWDA